MQDEVSEVWKKIEEQYRYDHEMIYLKLDGLQTREASPGQPSYVVKDDDDRAGGPYKVVAMVSASSDVANLEILFRLNRATGEAVPVVLIRKGEIEIDLRERSAPPDPRAVNRIIVESQQLLIRANWIQPTAA